MPLNSMSDNDIHRLRRACAYLFSPRHARDDAFLKGLDLESIKGAFRGKAKQYHPDHHLHETEGMTLRRKERFIKIKESYETLKSFIVEKGEPSGPEKPRRRRIIAVGGAKGGIGKSVFAANLGVMLASRGKKVVLIDLDLGGANLHLYLGETFLRGSINDFISGRAATLGEVMVHTRYGPYLIGGDSSRLGAANIHFSRKLKLMKSIERTDADYVIIDLGGDTSYNVIDFFLAADHGIVMTTCDPASYLDAYAFIKVSLLRKLTRIFGPESKMARARDPVLERLILEAVNPSAGGRHKKISGLLARVKKERPSQLALVRRELESYRPRLVVNMTSPESNVTAVAGRIREVAGKLLSIKVELIGTLPYQPEIRQSVRDLVPAVIRSPGGELSEKMGSILKRLGK